MRASGCARSLCVLRLTAFRNEDMVRLSPLHARARSLRSLSSAAEPCSRYFTPSPGVPSVSFTCEILTCLKIFAAALEERSVHRQRQGIRRVKRQCSHCPARQWDLWCLARRLFCAPAPATRGQPMSAPQRVARRSRRCGDSSRMLSCNSSTRRPTAESPEHDSTYLDGRT